MFSQIIAASSAAQSARAAATLAGLVGKFRVLVGVKFFQVIFQAIGTIQQPSNNHPTSNTLDFGRLEHSTIQQPSNVIQCVGPNISVQDARLQISASAQGRHGTDLFWIRMDQGQKQSTGPSVSAFPRIL